MSELGIGVIALLMLLGLFLTGLELAFAMGIIGVIGFAWIVDWKAAMGLMANDFFDALASLWIDGDPALCPHGPDRIQCRDSQASF